MDSSLESISLSESVVSSPHSDKLIVSRLRVAVRPWHCSASTLRFRCVSAHWQVSLDHVRKENRQMAEDLECLADAAQQALHDLKQRERVRTRRVDMKPMIEAGISSLLIACCCAGARSIAARRGDGTGASGARAASVGEVSAKCILTIFFQFPADSSQSWSRQHSQTLQRQMLAADTAARRLER